MESFLSPHSTAPPFELFGASHLWTILAIAVAGVVIVRSGMVADETVRRRLRWLMVGIFLFWEAEWQLWSRATDQWTIQRQLPLHMCSIMIWVAVYSLATNDKRVHSLIYFFGIAGSFQAVVTPDAMFDFPHVRYLCTMMSHGLLVIAGFWVVFVEGFRPTWRDVGLSLVVLNVYAVVIYPINVWIGANYLYVVDKPPTASLFDFFPEWPWYLLITEVIALGIFTAMCWPFYRRRVTGPGAAAGVDSDYASSQFGRGG